MTRAVFADLKERIVHLYLSEGWTMCQISETLQVSPGLVSKVIAIYRTYGIVIDLMKQRTGRLCNIDNDAAQYLKELLTANPNMYLDELQQRLQAVLDLNVSIATIFRTLRRLAITHKRVSKAAAERDEDLRLLWRLDIAQYKDPEMFVFLDESAVNNHTIARRVQESGQIRSFGQNFEDRGL
ncbi:Homeodomain-like protein [Ganoderma leucocontextum]|nr:Homeodomain-like protein [Ganoderma leucocontextum]